MASRRKQLPGMKKKAKTPTNPPITKQTQTKPSTSTSKIIQRWILKVLLSKAPYVADGPKKIWIPKNNSNNAMKPSKNN